ncbi:T9SS type A sorting domain-containing protein [Aquimarina sp. M1]
MVVKTISTFLLYCLAFVSNAQSIDTNVVSNAGGTNANTSHIITFTIGETFIRTISDSQSVEQGFWSGIAAQNILSTAEFQTDGRAIVVYPNPVSDFFTIRIPDIANYQLSIFNVSGQKVLSREVSPSPQGDRINISSLAKGIYMLTLFNTEVNDTKTFKIIKN